PAELLAAGGCEGRHSSRTGESAGYIPGGSHSLRYFYTAVSEPGPGLPRFSVAGYLDEQLFLQYDSGGQTAQPRAPWIRKEDPEYWQRQTWIARGWQEAFGGNVRIAMERHNQSAGLHTFQYAYGCARGADGSAEGFRRYGYDGRDFLSYDTRTHTWVAPSPAAALTRAKMESDSHLRRQQSDYLEHKCLQWLHKYLGYRQDEPPRTERPAVRVTSRDTPGGPSTLWCRAHGFYPRHITLSWLPKGDTGQGGVLPNGDGTYYAWATVQVDPQERGRYRCRVEHDSLEQPLEAAWEPPASAALVGTLATLGTVLLAAVAGAVLWWRRRAGRPDYAKAQASDGSSSATLPGSDSDKGSSSTLPGSNKGSSESSDPGYDSVSQESETGQLPAEEAETGHNPAAEQLLPQPPGDTRPEAV
ncbi:major histocompatibility complex class I-related protein 1-like, partial [Carettochelys insculpta]|uniref:major histocompatibility complex class I-related protein 1-like n=1 Tax=Carettochelys insculpta TaxID=44489 RepID=UPI003EBE4AB4